MCAYVNTSRDRASAQGKQKGGDKKKNRAEEGVIFVVSTSI
jgi:hypothetical protein